MLRLEGKEKKEVTFLGEEKVSCCDRSPLIQEIPLMREKKPLYSN